MRNLFNLENPLFSTLSKIFDLLIISIAYIFLCIPIVTIGPANTALYYTVVKVIRRERGYVFREFFKSFKLNFKRAAIVGVILTIVFAILAFDLIYAYGAAKNDSKGSIMMGVFIGITFLTIAFSVYVFPVLSRFDMTIKQLVRAAAFMSMRHILFTILMILVNVISLGIIYFVFQPFLLIAPALTVLVNSFMMERIFKKYMPTSDESGEDTGRDEWYLE